MNTATTTLESTAGKLFFVTGTNREVFLGKAIDEPSGERLMLEGKILSMTPHGRMVVRPFQTMLAVSTSDFSVGLHHLSNPRALDEATRLLSLSATHLHRGSAPLIYSWVESAMQMAGAAESTVAVSTPAGEVRRVANVTADPFLAFYETFLASTEEFRRVLFQTRQVESPRELDQITELEGDLTIEIGKIANQAAVKLNQVLQREREMALHLEAFRPTMWYAMNTRTSMSGWPYLFERLQIAKGWGRRNGKTELVREINALIKDCTFALNEVILDHSNSLDTLITETFGQYGIAHDIEAGLPQLVIPVPMVPSEVRPIGTMATAGIV